MQHARLVPIDMSFYLQDYERARQVYRTMLTVVPHKQFTFAKSWILAARFEVRRLDLNAARRLLGSGIGMSPKEALFKGYIQLEMDVSLVIICRAMPSMLISAPAAGVRPSANTLREVFRSTLGQVSTRLS